MFVLGVVCSCRDGADIKTTKKTGSLANLGQGEHGVIFSASYYFGRCKGGIMEENRK